MALAAVPISSRIRSNSMRPDHHGGVTMEEELEYRKAPQANLQTWSGVTRLIIISCVSIALFLLILAATLTP